jgi:ankyrin repeat protein
MKSAPSRFLIVFVCISIVGCEGTLRPSRQNPSQYTAFDAAIEGCDSTSVQRMLRSDRTLVKEKGWSDTAPLYLAALNNCTEVAELLLHNGAKVNARSKEGATPLHIAAQKGNLRLSKILRAHGGDITIKDSRGRTPADRARLWHHPDLAEYLKQ